MLHVALYAGQVARIRARQVVDRLAGLAVPRKASNGVIPVNAPPSATDTVPQPQCHAFPPGLPPCRILLLPVQLVTTVHSAHPPTFCPNPMRSTLNSCPVRTRMSTPVASMEMNSSSSSGRGAPHDSLVRRSGAKRSFSTWGLGEGVGGGGGGKEEV